MLPTQGSLKVICTSMLTCHSDHELPLVTWIASHMLLPLLLPLSIWVDKSVRTSDKQLSNSLRDSMGVAGKGEVKHVTVVVAPWNALSEHWRSSCYIWARLHGADLFGEPHWSEGISNSIAILCRERDHSDLLKYRRPEHCVGHWDLSAGSSLPDCGLYL